mgnify:CR=1 FL=1
MKPRIDGLVRVNVYKLVSEGIEAPLHFGIGRALKHGGPSMSDKEIERLVDAQMHELMNWFCETFRFDED